MISLLDFVNAPPMSSWMNHEPTEEPGRCGGHRPGDLVSADQEISCPSARSHLSAHREDPVSAVNLGIVRGTLAEWVRALGTGTTTGSTSSPSTPPGLPPSGQRPESRTARIALLEAQVRALEADKTKLSTEREILRSAAKYFAGETNW